SILGSQTESKVLGKVITQVRMDVERGSSLSAAMAKHPKTFTNLYVAMIRAGETGGVLDQVLLRLADNTEKDVALRQRVKSAMTYPVVVLAMVSLVLVAMLVFIVPQFKSIYSQLNGSLPLPTRILMGASEIFRKYFLFLVAASVGLVFLFKKWKKTERGADVIDRVKLKVPVF